MLQKESLNKYGEFYNFSGIKSQEKSQSKIEDVNTHFILKRGFMLNPNRKMGTTQTSLQYQHQLAQSQLAQNPPHPTPIPHQKQNGAIQFKGVIKLSDNYLSDPEENYNAMMKFQKKTGSGTNPKTLDSNLEDQINAAMLASHTPNIHNTKQGLYFKDPKKQAIPCQSKSNKSRPLLEHKLFNPNLSEKSGIKGEISLANIGNNKNHILHQKDDLRARDLYKVVKLGQLGGGYAVATGGGVANVQINSYAN
jgi:hypothetical protein